MDLKSIGKNIKQIRIEKKMTQAHLAEKTNLSTVHMSHIETGSVAMSLDTLLCICEKLNTTPDVILLGEYTLTEQSSFKILQQKLQKLTSDEKRLVLDFADMLDNVKVNRSSNN